MADNKRILIATGGTGGHIYPAMVTADELCRRGWDVSFAGNFASSGGILAARGFKYFNIFSRGFVSKNLWQKFLASIYLVKAFFSCAGIILRIKPAVILGFGGYSSFPCVIAGKLWNIPSMIHEQNVCPGEANKALARVVKKVAISFRDSAKDFPTGKTVLTGCPMRSMRSGHSRGQILKQFGLQENRKTVLVFGGSQGSRAINDCAVSCFEKSCILMPYQVIHLSGKSGFSELAQRYERLSFPSFVAAYLDHIEDAYAVSDCVIGRSGAGTVTELGLLGIPSILIPYPYAKSHQEANAQVLVRQMAAEIIHEKDLNPSLLGDKIFIALTNAASRKALRLKLAEEIVSNAVSRLADEVECL